MQCVEVEPVSVFITIKDCANSLAPSDRMRSAQRNEPPIYHRRLMDLKA
ncbi:hypothetical protein TPChic_1036a [Treponema pallidum subsp. pallidum str. Chicago]|nr:hypothetical protein TPChic_1036a [Treponema pallidum subsp. pallidum str. Chicago]